MIQRCAKRIWGVPAYLVSWVVMGAVVSPGYATDSGSEFPFDVPFMKEQSAEAGLTHVYDGGWEFFVGGGAASLDCNGDRMPDLFLAGGVNPAKLYINQSRSGGEIQFEEMPLGLSSRDAKKVLGAYPLDFDNDRKVDLFVLRLGENLLLKGNGDCTFEKVNRRVAFDGGRSWSTAFSATWEMDNRFPTLAVGNYVDRSAPGSPWGTCDRNRLFRPVPDTAGQAANGDDNLPDYGRDLALVPGHCALSISFTDWNKTGVAGLRMTNDRQYYRGGQEQLWQVNPGASPRLYRAAEGWKTVTIWGMGIAETDLTGDGFPEYALTSMGDTKVMTLDEESDEDRPTYRDIAYEKGLTAHRPYTGGDNKPSTGWHAQFADLNNDARTDLFIAKGNVEAMPDFAKFDPDNLRMQDHDGMFHEKGAEAGIARDTKGRGSVIEDFNADGMLDLLVMNRGSNLSLFRNMGSRTEWGYRPMGNWLMVELDNGEVNPDAIGAKIHVKTGNLNQTRTLQIGGGHASGQNGFVHFGLGVAERATVRVQWPDGEWSHEYRVFANNFTVVRRKAPEAMVWYPVSD